MIAIAVSRVVVRTSSLRESTLIRSRKHPCALRSRPTSAVGGRSRNWEKQDDLRHSLPSLHRRSFIRFGLVSCACLFTTAQLSAQDTKTVKSTSGSGISVTSYQEIPAATEPCTSVECEWWNRLRQAGNKLLRKGDQKSKRAYASLFVEGIEKSYRIPLKDRSALTLVFGPRVQTADLQSKEKNGTVKLSIEHRADGSIGDVRVLKGLGPKTDQRCIYAAQSFIFLPAVRDRTFVDDWQTSEFKFFHAGSAR